MGRGGCDCGSTGGQCAGYLSTRTVRDVPGFLSWRHPDQSSRRSPGRCRPSACRRTRGPMKLTPTEDLVELEQAVQESDASEPAKTGIERRQYERYETSISVDYSSGETFLF